METDQIIERIGSDENPPTIEELTGARDELAAARDELADTIKSSKETTDFAAIVAMKGEFDAVTDALTKVSDALAAAQAEIDAIIADVEGGAPADAAPAAEGDVVEADADTVEDAAPVAASVRATLARIRTKPRTDDTPDLSAVRQTFVLRGRDRDSLTPQEVGEAFADVARSFGGSKTSVLSIRQDLHPDRQLKEDAAGNERKLLALFGANPVIPVTASGGCCSIPEPIYDQPLIGSLDRPIRSSMDVMQASRGAVTAYPPVCIPDEGADVWTCAQDAAVDPDDPDTWKECVDVECEDADPTVVEPIYKCLTIGTFQQKFAPEQWQAFLFQADKLAARKAEARLFDWLWASHTGLYTGFATGSTYANWIKSLIRGAALIRQDQRLGDAQVVVYGPEWMYSAAAEDTLTRRLNEVDEPEIVRQRVDAVLANEGITYVPSQDVASLSDSSYDGSSFAPYLTSAPMVMIAAGSAKVLDGGEKNLGIDISDHSLNRQNKVAAFSEFWEGLLVRSCNIKSINVPVEDCDTIPCPS